MNAVQKYLASASYWAELYFWCFFPHWYIYLMWKFLIWYFYTGQVLYIYESLMWQQNPLKIIHFKLMVNSLICFSNFSESPIDPCNYLHTLRTLNGRTSKMWQLGLKQNVDEFILKQYFKNTSFYCARTHLFTPLQQTCLFTRKNLSYHRQNINTWKNRIEEEK